MNKFEREPFNPFGEHGKEQAPKVKDSWLKGVAEGYALWPGRLNPGVSIFTMEAVLNDPPDNWNEFLTSSLSSKHVAKLEKSLNAHKKEELPYTGVRGFASWDAVIEYGDLRHRNEEPQDVEQSLQLLWMDTTDIVGNTIINISMGSKLYLDDYGRERTFNTESIFSNPEILAIDRVKPTIAAAKRGLLSSDGLEIAELYRLGGSKSVKEGDTRHKILLDKYIQRYEELNPHAEAQEEANEFFEGMQILTAEELFASEHRSGRFGNVCTELIEHEIEKSIASEGLKQKYGAWTGY